jgi:hypothetical protein
VKVTDGKLMVTVTRKEMVQLGAGGAFNPPGAAPAVARAERVVTKAVELGEVKDLQITTADGKKIDTAEAIKRLKDGGVVVVSADGKPVSPQHLKLFKDDVLVLTSPELVLPTGGVWGPVPGQPQPRPGVRPLPAVPAPGGVLPIQPQVLPANPGGVIQIQIQPGGMVQVIPLQPAPAPAPAPEK